MGNRNIIKVIKRASTAKTEPVAAPAAIANSPVTARNGSPAMVIEGWIAELRQMRSEQYEVLRRQFEPSVEGG